jgi:hypothetical protein
VRALAGALLASSLALPAGAGERGEDAVPGIPFQEGDVIPFEQIDKLQGYLPEQFWEHREYFFYEGMRLEIGPFFRDYGPSPTYLAATEKHASKASVGRDDSLAGYAGGLPFPGAIDCKGDPDAGTRIIWNFRKSWNGGGGKARWFYSYWDRGEQLPLYYVGNAQGIGLANRIEPQYEATGGDIFPGEKRLFGGGIHVEEPFDARGIMTLSYRYKAADGPRDTAKNDDTWVYIPDLRRVRRISSAQRTDSVSGTDFTVDDLRSFNGIPPQYEWTCLGERDAISPFNTAHLAYPYRDDYNFGPYGFSFANDRWEMRHAWIVRFVPKNEDHPYSRKDIWIDKQTWEPLYSFAYDRKKELWKIIWHNHRWSEDWRGETPERRDPASEDGVWYPTWEGVDQVRDLRVVGDIIVNVQTGTGNRIEFWDNTGTPLTNKGKIRRLVDIGRLNKGR